MRPEVSPSPDRRFLSFSAQENHRRGSRKRAEKEKSRRGVRQKEKGRAVSCPPWFRLRGVDLRAELFAHLHHILAQIGGRFRRRDRFFRREDRGVRLILFRDQ